MREQELFALGPSTGTGNEKRRTLRKSIPVQTCYKKRFALHRGVFYTVDYYGESRIRSRELITIFSAFCRFLKRDILTRLRKTKLCD